jgi:hypothetical protein
MWFFPKAILIIAGDQESASHRKIPKIALIAYLLLLIARKDDIKPGKPWSIFQLKTNFTLDMIHNQFQHSIRLEVNKSLKAA